MDVNNVGKNITNINSYNLNENLSQYAETYDRAVPQVEKVQTQPQDMNKIEKNEYSKKDLDEALKKINNFLKDEHTHAEYSIHEDFHTVMIKIIDDNSKQVVLELPSKKVLDMVASMMKQVGLLDKKA
ncbi:flagellar protein FlaG [Clostridium beijerinckii]|uniref:Flagellar protein FlaG n=1 Tax=Clostridium beijerinckii TaxID=1520 RepID=A0A7X9SJZ2_CLOBE|nr:flagellar protein FlaG [Clostridium beijerinckii]NMF03255.1 flagellar protein FlaG [Clostridium beijerinckii]